jgi:hypothetical protein
MAKIKGNGGGKAFKNYPLKQAAEGKARRKRIFENTKGMLPNSTFGKAPKSGSTSLKGEKK